MKFPTFTSKEPASPDVQRVGRPEFRDLIASRTVFFEKGLDLMATCLPNTDRELHQWLEQAIEENDALMFSHVISAAALVGRPLDASLLPRGAALMRNDDEFSNIAWHCQGDVAGALLEAARGGALRPEREAAALFCAAAWWQKHREGAYPPEILTRSRELARKAKGKLDMIATLGPLGLLIGSEELQRMISFGRPGHFRQSHVGMKKAMIGILEAPFRNIVPEGYERGFSAGTTMRSAMPEVERNDPCRCGSGKKYKKCCQTKDMGRWRQSSDVAGLTTTELGEELGQHLSKTRLEKMEAHELAKLDPKKVPAELVSVYLAGLSAFKRYEELIKAFQQLGVEGDREEDWIAAFTMPMKDWQPKIAWRLLKLHPRGKEMLPDLTPATRLLLAPEKPGKFYEAVEQETMAALKTSDLDDLRSVALGVLHSPMRVLGIMMARSVLPLVDDAAEIFEEILLTRDKLNLPEDDEFAEYMEEQATRRRKSNGDDAAHKWQELYELEKEERRRLTEELRKAERELALREKRAHREAAANVPALPSDARAIAELQTKVKTLEVRLRESNEKAAANLREAKKEDERTRREEAAADEKAKKEGGDEEYRVEGIQPVRLILFPKDFQETLETFPKHVARATMNRLGRLAAGEKSAFDKVKQLKAYPDVLRAQVSGSHRFLFKLEPKHVRVVDLIRRADLDRRIERLKAAGLPPVA